MAMTIPGLGAGLKRQTIPVTPSAVRRSLRQQQKQGSGVRDRGSGEIDPFYPDPPRVNHARREKLRLKKRISLTHA